MAATSGKNSKVHVFEASNRASIQIINNTSLTTVADQLASHKSSLNTSAHTVDNISGLQTALNGKQNVISGYTGNVNVVTGVNFDAKTITKVEIKIVNGVITSID